jgi:PPM family protein phosphatase
VRDYELEIGALTDVGTGRASNEDACGSFMESDDTAMVAVADGVSSYPGGDVASSMAIEGLIRAFREEPRSAGAGQRLYRAFQHANIEVYDRAIAVPELRGMATTLTAVAVERGLLTAVHVGDSRLYLVRSGEILQLTKDHTVVAGRARLGLMDPDRARNHPDKGVLTRSLGRELIVSRDRLTRRIVQGDLLLLCSDGLHGVLEDPEMAHIVVSLDAVAASAALVRAANARGTPDNLTAAVLRITGPTPAQEAGTLAARLRRMLGGRP